ncbi:hypothetical protein FB566_3683 [Stackebrandtia endophytica]|uniref:Lipoprotein n=1 Tax=Stackebrandtia endophytica TaxID=1496996 RepID=A0A543AZX7_9ACTN|nr:hypothetical protein [Stackebrandtia endophytica]TQL78106.1 hypothetical protein FB566_3683 [Stackebrandtia endophytica]
MPHRIPFTVIGSVALLAVAGCTATGTFDDPVAAARQVLDEGLTNLTGQPALRVTGTVSVLGGYALEEAEVTATVLHDGTAWIEFTTADVEGEMLALPGSLHILGGDDFWKAEDYRFGQVERLDGNWTRVKPGDWFNPGTMFRPADFGPLLREAVDADLTPSLDTVDLDGVEAFPIEYSGGTFHVTVEEPHRFAGMTDVELSATDPSTGVRYRGVYTIQPVDVDGLEELRLDVQKALRDMDNPFSVTGNVQVTTDDVKLDCTDDILCTVTVDATATVLDAAFTEEVMLILSAEIVGERVGTETCSSEWDAEPDEEIEIWCITDFTYAPPGRFVFGGDQWVDWLATYRFDTDAAETTLGEAMETALSRA